MDENLTPIIVALVGFFQVALAIYFGRRLNKANTMREKATATESIGSTYSTLVQRLEERLEKLETNYDKLCAEYEKDKAAWTIERAVLMAEIGRLEKLIDAK